MASLAIEPQDLKENVIIKSKFALCIQDTKTYGEGRLKHVAKVAILKHEAKLALNIWRMSTICIETCGEGDMFQIYLFQINLNETCHDALQVNYR